MAENALTPSDVALLQDRGDGMWGGGGAFFWIFALLILAGGNGFSGNHRGDYVTNANQSQYILSQLGRFVAWTPSGTQASTAG